MKNSALLPLAAVAAAISFTAVSQAQVSYSTAASTYSQDFSALPDVTGNFAWANNTTIAGWYYTPGAAFDTTFGGNGRGANELSDTTTSGLTSNRIFSFFPSASATDNALGLALSGSGGAFGLRITNTTGATLHSFTLSYTGEQWYQTASAGALNFTYLVTNGNNAPTAFGTSGLDIVANGTSVGALGFTAPQTGTAGNLDGSLVANQVSVSSTVSGLSWANNTDLYLVWRAGSNSSALAIDDLSFSAAAIPEPSAFAALAGLGVLGLAASRRRRA